MNEIPPSGALIGKSVLRLEDPALLRGRAHFVDDLPVKPGTLHAAILRSPHAHAEIVSIDTGRARQMPGVAAVITRAEVLALTDRVWQQSEAYERAALLVQEAAIEAARTALGRG